MRPLALLKCVARAALKGGANLVGLGELVEQVWADWDKQQDEAARRAELEAVVRLAADDFRQQVETVVREVAGGQPAAVQQRVSSYLQQVPELVRGAFRRPEDQQGRSVPPGFRVNQAGDLVALLSAPPSRPPAAAEARVSLHFSKGQQAGQTLVFTEPAVLLFGRDAKCEPRFSQESHGAVSRHHCLVEIIPPDVRIRDLGSKHGTFLNDHLIGKRPDGVTEPDPKYASPEHDLKDGDKVRLTNKGQVTFEVRIVVPARCAACGAGIAEEQKVACTQGPNQYLCPACRSKGAEVTAARTCSWCHRDVTEAGANRPGLFVCGDCRTNMQGLMQGLLAQAQAGQQELRAIRDYTFVEELGHGGMGAVSLARHNKTGQAVAVKLMLPKVAADDRAVEMFQREVRNTMTLQHRHVVRLLDHGYSRGTFFMVLEYCDGGSVDLLLAQRGGKLPVDEAVEIILQALEGLEYAHQVDIPFVKKKGGGYGPGKGLVHRDLKPANLFLTGWGSNRIVKIGDYGLAKTFDETGLSGGTRTGEVAGTWEFICREQVAHCNRPRPEMDVWAMAASLYNMLTGHVPRDFPGDQDPWLAVLENPALPILRRDPHIPPRLAQVIDQALVEEPEMPFKSAAEFREALEAAL